MVDCPHLLQSVCIAHLDLEQLKRFGSGRPENIKQKKVAKGRPNPTPQTRNSLMLKKKQEVPVNVEDGNWNCVECGTSQCPWLCLSCGLIHCGRYVNQDGLIHYKTYPSHSICMDCYNYSVFCYQCDDFIACDTEDHKISSVRSSLEFYNSSRCDDHSYSSAKYESVPEPEEVIEISADESPPIFYDEGTEEEVDGTRAVSKPDKFIIHGEVDSLEVQLTTEQDAEGDHEDSSPSENDRTNPVEFHLASSGDEQADKEDDSDSAPESVFLRRTTRNETPTRTTFPGEAGDNTRSAPALMARRKFTLSQRSLRKRKRKESDSVSDESVRSTNCEPAALSITPSSKSKSVTDVKKLRGLKNLGNTCFMNSVIQALNSIGIFRYFMNRLPPLEMDVYLSDSVTARTPRYNTRSSLPVIGEKRVNPTFLAEELRKTLIELSSGASQSGAALNAYGPDALLTEVCKFAPRFRGFQQHDAHEFLRCILDRMHTELKNCRLPDWLLSEVCEGGVRLASGSHFVTNKRRNRGNKQERACVISAMFEGSLQSQVTCLECNTTSCKQDPFLDLSLDICLPTNGQRPVSVRLEECMRHFFAKEELDSCEQYLCNVCHDKRPSTKQLFVKSLPNVLCFHIKRFRWSNLQRGKLDTMVEFPLKGLDMKSFMINTGALTVGLASTETSTLDEDSRSNSFSSCSSASGSTEDSSTIYDLSSLVVHHGAGTSSGHYSSYGLHDSQWHHFNDSTVKQCPEQHVAQQRAYLLFYNRRTHS